MHLARCSLWSGEHTKAETHEPLRLAPEVPTAVLVLTLGKARPSRLAMLASECIADDGHLTARVSPCRIQQKIRKCFPSACVLSHSGAHAYNTELYRIGKTCVLAIDACQACLCIVEGRQIVDVIAKNSPSWTPPNSSCNLVGSMICQKSGVVSVSLFNAATFISTRVSPCSCEVGHRYIFEGNCIDAGCKYTPSHSTKHFFRRLVLIGIGIPTVKLIRQIQQARLHE